MLNSVAINIIDNIIETTTTTAELKEQQEPASTGLRFQEPLGRSYLRDAGYDAGEWNTIMPAPRSVQLTLRHSPCPLVFRSRCSTTMPWPRLGADALPLPTHRAHPCAGAPLMALNTRPALHRTITPHPRKGTSISTFARRPTLRRSATPRPGTAAASLYPILRRLPTPHPRSSSAAAQSTRPVLRRTATPFPRRDVPVERTALKRTATPHPRRSAVSAEALLLGCLGLPVMQRPAACCQLATIPSDEVL